MITPGPTPNRRNYRSRLRGEQADQTRVRILEAAAEVMTDTSAPSFTIDRVAKRAGVAVRTVYHHFADREALIRALDAFIDNRAGIGGIDFPAAPADIGPMLQAVFESFDEHETFIRAHLISQAGREVRSYSRADRRGRIQDLLQASAPNATAEQLKLAAALTHYLVSSEAWRSMKDESGLSGREAADAVTWALSTLLKDLAGGEANSERGSEK